MMKKELYAAPATEVLELHLEGVIAASEPQLRNAPQFNDPYGGNEETF